MLIGIVVVEMLEYLLYCLDEENILYVVLNVKNYVKEVDIVVNVG